MIERRNIIKLLGDRMDVYHSAILTCFNFDPIFFEKVYLPTLRRLGISNIIVLTDAGMYDQLLSDDSYHCHRVSMNGYTLVRQENTHRGVFHSKMLLLFGSKEAAIIIGSGNVTFSGMSNNAEVWNAFHVQEKDSPNLALFIRGWEYAQWLLKGTSNLIKRQLEWIIEQSDWIKKDVKDITITMDNGETAMLLYNNEKSTIYADFLEQIGNADVDTITVIAPFYDTKGDAINKLKEALQPKTFRCVFDPDRQSAPYDLMSKQSDVTFYEYNTANNPPLHAKIIEVQASNGSWLLSGSANIGSLALGTIKGLYNDEACVLVHSKNRKDYIGELGLEGCWAPIGEEELKKIDRPKPDDTPKTVKPLCILSGELSDGKLQLKVNTSDEECQLVVLDQDLNVIIDEPITTKTLMTIDTSDETYMVVFQKDGHDVSNRLLVLSESNVERCNPDPTRRQLSRLLDDADLLSNLSHILGIIEFDETPSKQRAISTKMLEKKKTEDKMISVSQEQYDILKDDSNLSISMHSGVRILNFLKSILFKQDEPESNEDELFELKKENEGNEKPKRPALAVETTELDSDRKMRNEVLGYLDRMVLYLRSKMEDSSVQKEGNPLMPLKKGCLPKLEAIPNLNLGSAFAIATNSVAVLMVKYGDNMVKDSTLRCRFHECACLYFALFRNHFNLNGGNKEKVIQEMLKEATIKLFVSLSYFDFCQYEYLLILTVLNGFDAWGEEKDILYEIMKSFRDNVAKMDNNKVVERTYSLINQVFEKYITNDTTPVRDFSEFHNAVFLYRSGYGFFYAYDIKVAKNGVRFSYYHPRYTETIQSPLKTTKYKGYTLSEFKVVNRWNVK